MKTIPNAMTRIEKDGNNLTYAEIAKICLNAPPPGGFVLDEIRLRLKIIERLDHAHARIELEDAEYQKLREVVRAFHWGQIHKDILAFADAIESAETVEADVEVLPSLNHNHRR